MNLRQNHIKKLQFWAVMLMEIHFVQNRAEKYEAYKGTYACYFPDFNLIKKITIKTSLVKNSGILLYHFPLC